MDPSNPFSDSDLEDLDDVVRGAARAPMKQPVCGAGAPDARIGSVLLGKYRIESILGLGGMAVVYRATHRNGAMRAIKMLRPEYATNLDICRRFRGEGRCANAVRHPGAVSVIDDDVTEDGAAFLVLELLDGVSCDELCLQSGGRVPVDVACAIGLQALDVLEAAHAAGVVHRDIKPGNLFLTRSGIVKVLDFGIARFRASVTSLSHATQTGYRLGTPAFMAPEQLAGASEDLDGRADLWSLGASIYAMTSGAIPARPARSIALATPELPRKLVEVVDRALAFDPAARWPSAGAMKAALEQAALRSLQDIPGSVVLARIVTRHSDTEAKQAATRTLPAAGEPAPGAGAESTPTISGLVAISATSRASAPAQNTKPSAGDVTRPDARQLRGSAWQRWITAISILTAVGAGAAAWDAFRPAASPAVVAAYLAASTTSQSAGQAFSRNREIDGIARTQEPIASPKPDATSSSKNGTPRVAPAPGAFPRSCAEARAAGSTTDATLRIDPDGNGPLRPFEVFCANMGDASQAPEEYVTLPNSDLSGHPEANATQFTWRGSACECPDLVRRFHRVRIDPGAMVINPRDATFASYDRSLACEARHPSHCGDRVELAWGSPGSCRGPSDTSGTASIDLRGTPFALAPTTTFVPAGFGAAGEAVVAPNRQTATLRGGGQCGFLVPSDETIGVVQRP